MGRSSRLASAARRAALVLGAALAFGASALPARAAGRVHGTTAPAAFVAPRVAHGPVIDGRLDDAVWAEAAVLDSFTHTEPVEGVPDTLGTEVWVLYDATRLYFGVRARDHAGGVRAPLVPRDQTGEGDELAIALDTFLDRQRSIVLGANPLGVQLDGLNSDAADYDDAPDFQFDSRGRLTPEGWELELAVPFRSLRFPRRDTLAFGLQVLRNVQRTGEELMWAPVRSDVSTFHGQFGTMGGLTGIHPGRALQVTPYANAQVAGEAGAGGLSYGDAETRAGVDVQYGLTSSLVADATLDPDFSQIEADAGVVELNQRFDLFFAEKRPFFLGGSDLFKTPLDLVYTRRIRDPRVGARLTGKSGATAIGVLGALDRADGESVAGIPDGANPYFDRDAACSLVRLERDVFGSSYVGLLASAREQLETYQRGLAADGRIAAGPAYLAAQGAWSWARERDLRAALAAPGADPDALEDEPGGHAGALASGRAWIVRGGYEDRSRELSAYAKAISSDFTADLGFVPRRGVFEHGGHAERRFFGGDGAAYAKATPMLTWNRTREVEGAPFAPGRLLDESIEAEFEVEFMTASNVGPGVGRYFTFEDGREYRDQWRAWVFGGSDYLAWLHFGGFASFGDDVLFEEARRARSVRTEIEATLRPSARFKVTTAIHGTRLWRKGGGTRAAEQWIPRLRFDWQWSRELSVRWIHELDVEHRWSESGAMTRREHGLTTDVLVTWLLRPGTAVYAGYGAALEGPGAFDVRPRENRLFTKASWLFQL